MILGKISSLQDVAICDPSCGDGQFLVALAERVCRKIKACRSTESRTSYYSTLRKLTGVDIDAQALAQCRARLDRILAQYGCDSVKWNLHQADALDQDKWEKFSRFDYVLGNPPYVRIQNLEKNRREKIAGGNWESIQGCTDLFILFFELGLRLTKPGGKMIYITPSSWMKSRSGKRLREFLISRHRICSVTDFGDYQVFQNVTTYTAITEIAAWQKGKQRVKAWKCKGFKGASPILSGGNLHCGENGWQVLSNAETHFIQSIARNNVRLRDVADIHVGIQTLADSVFIFSQGAVDVEPDITRKIFKASVMKNGKDTDNRVAIYPYINGKLMPEWHISQRYPKAYAYLLGHKKRLLQRDKGAFDPQKWYGYGRDVAITSAFGDKLLTSSMNRAPNFQRCPDPNALFYSGYCVKPKENIDPQALLDELNSKNMEEFIRLVSRPFQNGWFSYAKSFIQDYPIGSDVYV